MKVLITGATGLVGTSLVRELSGRQVSLVVVTRQPGRNLHFDNSVEVLAWRGADDPLPERALHGVDGVVHLMGENVGSGRWTESRKQRIHDSRIRTTDRIAEAVRKRGQPLSFLVSTSAVGYYGDRGEETLSESAGPGQGFLSELCRDWERAAEAVPSTRTVLFRVGLVLAANGGFLAKVLPAFRMGLGAVVGSGNQWVSWIHILDLVRLYGSAVLSTEWKGVHNAVSLEPVTNRKFGEELSTVLGKPFFLKAPAAVLKLALGEAASLALGSTRAVADAEVQRLLQFPTLQEALKDLCGASSQLP